MPQLYKPCACCGGFLAAAESDLPDFQSIIDRLAKDMYDNPQSAESINFDKELLQTTAQVFAESVNAAIAESVDWSTPDAAMRASLMENVWHFSSAKNYQQLLDMSQMLYDEAGDLRSFAAFKKLALEIDKKYNLDWLATERNFAISSSQMAARWGEHEQTADDNPYLQYQTVGDANVRDSHKNLDGITKKIDDAFWDTYFPPNGWNCRCTVIQLSGDKHSATDTKKSNLPVIDKPFRQNMGKSKVVFPDGHPYYEGIPKEVYNSAVNARIAASRTDARSWGKKNVPQNGLKVEIENQSIKEVLLKKSDIKNATSKPNKQAADVYLMIKQLGNVLSKSKFIKSKKDSGINATVKKWHYFEFVFDGIKQYINVKEMKDGTFRLHAITDSLK